MKNTDATTYPGITDAEALRYGVFGTLQNGSRRIEYAKKCDVCHGTITVTRDELAVLAHSICEEYRR